MQATTDKVIVLGKGFVGSHLQGVLDAGGIDHECFSRAELDYHSIDTVRQMLLIAKPRALVIAFGLTGSPNVDACEDMPRECWWLNYSLPCLIAAECAKRGVHCIHLSTGCIFDGYTHGRLLIQYQECDEPNNGLFSPTSSLYCKAKHAAEIAVEHLPISIVRVRMPYSDYHHPRNYLNKILSYDKVLDKVNSKTCLHDLAKFVLRLSTLPAPAKSTIYHAVNPNPITVTHLLELFIAAGLHNPRWELVESVKTRTTRSNCVLFNGIPNSLFTFKNEEDAITSAIERLAESNTEVV